MTKFIWKCINEEEREKLPLQFGPCKRGRSEIKVSPKACRASQPEASLRFSYRAVYPEVSHACWEVRYIGKGRCSGVLCLRKFAYHCTVQQGSRKVSFRVCFNETGYFHSEVMVIFVIADFYLARYLHKMCCWGRKKLLLILKTLALVRMRIFVVPGKLALVEEATLVTEPRWLEDTVLVRLTQHHREIQCCHFRACIKKANGAIPCGLSEKAREISVLLRS